jgi:hypothetical protein
MKRFFKYSFLLFSIITLNSCIGIVADIQMRKDGSVKAVLEYRFSRMGETIGKLDGNEKWPVIPVGREDWKRTEQRVEGMKVASFSSREDARDIINKVTLEFKNTESFLKFLDPTGKRASLITGEKSNKLHITLNERPSSQMNSELLDLVWEVCGGYSFKIGLSAPKNAAIDFTDGEGKQGMPPATEAGSSSGKKAAVSIDTAAIFTAEAGVGVDLIWD